MNYNEQDQKIIDTLEGRKDLKPDPRLLRETLDKLSIAGVSLAGVLADKSSDKTVKSPYQDSHSMFRLSRLQKIGAALAAMFLLVAGGATYSHFNAGNSQGVVADGPQVGLQGGSGAQSAVDNASDQSSTGSGQVASQSDDSDQSIDQDLDSIDAQMDNLDLDNSQVDQSMADQSQS